MSVNLLELAQGAMSGPVLSQLSGILDLSEEQAQAGIKAILPAILGGLVKKAAVPSGAEEILQQIKQQDDSLLDNLGVLLRGAEQEKFFSAGLTIAKSLFGNQFDAISNVLSNTSGLDSNTNSNLLSCLVPVVMSVLRRQTSQRGLDASSLAIILGEQQEYLRAATPTDLGRVLGLSEMLSDAAGTVADDTKSSRAARSTAEHVAGGTHAMAPVGGSAIGKLAPLIGLLALALLAWMFIKGGAQESPPVRTTSEVDAEEVRQPAGLTPITAGRPNVIAEEHAPDTAETGTPE